MTLPKKIRAASAVALAGLGNRSAIPALQQDLKNKDEDDWVRLRMAQAVAGLGGDDAVPVLLDLAREADAKMTRLEAIGTLSKLARVTDPPPTDPDAPEGQAFIEKLDRSFSEDGKRLRHGER